MCAISGTRCQQQREASVEGNDPVAIGGIILGEGVETEGEQEYGYELFHVDRKVLKPQRALFMDKLKCLDRRSGLTEPDHIFAR